MARAKSNLPVMMKDIIKVSSVPITRQLNALAALIHLDSAGFSGRWVLDLMN